MQQAAANPGQVQEPVQTVPPASAAWENQRSKYSSKLLILGILQIGLSGVSLLFGLIDCLVLGCSYAATGIWGGILFYFPAGALLFLTAKSASAPKQVAIASLVMCILSAVLAVLSFVMYTAAFGINLKNVLYGFGGAAAVAAFNSLVSLAEVVIAIISAFHCRLVLKTPQISTMSDQQPQVQPNTCISQPPNTWAPGGNMANPAPMYPPNN